MSKPKKKRPHKCRKSINITGKYGKNYKCRSCPYKYRGQYSPINCPNCGGNLVLLKV